MAPPNKKSKLGDSGDSNLSRKEDEDVVIAPEFNHQHVNHRNVPQVIEMLAQLTVDLCGNQITYDLLKLQLINSVWKQVVDDYLRNTTDNSLTIEVNFSAPPPEEEEEEMEPRLQVVSENWLEYASFASSMHVRDVAAAFDRFSKMEREEVAYELKGPLIRVQFEAINDFSDFIRSLNANAPIDYLHNNNDVPGTMNQTTLSLAFIDSYRNRRNEVSLKKRIMTKEKYQPLIDLEKLFPKLVNIHLTTALTSNAPYFLKKNIWRNDPASYRYSPFYDELVASVAQRNHVGGPLRSVDFNFLHYRGDVESSPLRQLLPQLEHLGLNYPVRVGDGKPEPFFSSEATTRLRSLKCQQRESNFQPDNGLLFKDREDAAVVFRQLTSLEIKTCFYQNFLQQCTALNSLKVYMPYLGNTASSCYQLKLFTPMRQSLQHLTLINLDLPLSLDIELSNEAIQLPRVTTLTLISRWTILRGFQARNGLVGGNVNVPHFVQMLCAVFPALQSLNLMGAVFQADDVRRQLEQLLTEQRPGVTLNWHCNNIPES